MKYLLTLLFTINLLNAFDLYKGQCIESLSWYSTTFVYYEKYNELQPSAYRSELLIDFDLNQLDIENSYIVVGTACRPESNLLGMNAVDYNFLLGLCGLIFGAVFLFFTVDAFVKVGKK